MVGPGELPVREVRHAMDPSCGLAPAEQASTTPWTTAVIIMRPHKRVKACASWVFRSPQQIVLELSYDANARTGCARAPRRLSSIRHGPG